MGACVPNCIKTYIFDQDLYIQGNKIFKKINTNLNTEKLKLTAKEKKTLE